MATDIYREMLQIALQQAYEREVRIRSLERQIAAQRDELRRYLREMMEAE